MPSQDSEEGDKIWKKTIDRLKITEGFNGMIIYPGVRFVTMKKIYENLTENLTDKQISIDCGKEPNCDGEFNAMIRL